MRLALALLLSAAALPAPAGVRAQAKAQAQVQAQAGAPAAFAAFDRTIAATKEAMMRDPAQALSSARRALALARRLPPSPRARVAHATALWLNGEALIFLNDLTGATGIIDRGLAEAARAAPGTKLHGDLLRSHGALMAATGQALQALRDYQHAHEVFQRAGIARSRALALQDIGQIYWEAGDYAKTLAYYEQSAEVYNDPPLTLTMHNNRAEVFRKQRRWREAAAAYRAALVQAQKLDSPLLQVRILTNLAGSEAEAGRLPQAQAAAVQALRLSRHGEAAGWQPFVYGAAAKVAAGRGDHAQAAQFLARTFADVELARTDLLFREYHETAADVFERLGDDRLALAHLKAFERLDNEAQRLTASAAAQLVSARFDFANQNLKISKLKQDQLKREVAMERQESRFRGILFTGLAAFGGLVFGMLLFGYLSIRRSRNEVHAANGSLLEVNGALEKALKARTEFLAATSHEIRTPLNGILGMTQVLLADRRVAGDVRGRIEVVHGAGETMRALVDDILDVAKMEKGRLTVHREPTDLRRILDDAAQLWGGQAEAKGLRLVLDADGAPERIVTDGPRLRQVVFNLMSNALKFTAEGQVTLAAAVEDAGDGAERLVIRVADTGIGIPADAQGEIFEAFRQVDAGTTRQFGGTGLGLAICRQLARALGGDVGVESRPGEGTVFTVRLPLERAAEQAPADAEEGSALAGVRVLLVGMDPAPAALVRLLLAAEEAVVAVVPDAQSAVAALAQGDAGHVLADAPAVADLRLLATAARDAGALLSALVPAAAVADAMLAGADQLIAKPIAAPDLVAALRSLHGDAPEAFVAPALTAPLTAAA